MLMRLANLRDLDVRESDVRNLTGLEHAKNLSRLSAGGNSVSDLCTTEEINQSEVTRFLGEHI